MVWKYKLVEYNTQERNEIYQQINNLKQQVLKEIAEKLDWKEKQKGLSKEEKDIFLNKELYPQANAVFSERIKKLPPEFGNITIESITNNQKSVTINHIQYLELKINANAERGWILDKIRNYKGMPNDGFIIFKRKDLSE